MKQKSVIASMLTIAIVVILCQPAFADDTSDIVAAMTQRIDNYLGAPRALDSAAVKISGSYALIGYSLGEGGGEGLLSKTSGSWQILVKGGGIINQNLMMAYGVDQSDAAALAASCVAMPRRPGAAPIHAMRYNATFLNLRIMFHGERTNVQMQPNSVIRCLQ